MKLLMVSVLVLVLAASATARSESIESRLIDPLRKEHRHAELAMLSVTIIAVGGGMAFFGLRFLKAVLFFVGFISGFIASFLGMNSFMDSDPALWGVCMATGVIGGLLAYCFEKVGKCLCGGFFAMFLTYMSYLTVLHFIPSHSDTTLYVVMAVACCGGLLLGMRAHRVFLGVMTSLTGAFGVVFGVDMMTHHQLNYSHLKHGDLDGLGWALIAIWGVLSLVAFYFQMCFKFDKKKKNKGDKRSRVGRSNENLRDPMLVGMHGRSYDAVKV
jgi:hypothetical protein